MDGREEMLRDRGAVVTEERPADHGDDEQEGDTK
jgi:hypothetical protein